MPPQEQPPPPRPPKRTSIASNPEPEPEVDVDAMLRNLSMSIARETIGESVVDIIDASAAVAGVPADAVDDAVPPLPSRDNKPVLPTRASLRQQSLRATLVPNKPPLPLPSEEVEESGETSAAGAALPSRAGRKSQRVLAPRPDAAPPPAPGPAPFGAPPAPSCGASGSPSTTGISRALPTLVEPEESSDEEGQGYDNADELRRMTDSHDLTGSASGAGKDNL